jgi:putative aldouronate transport system substrate-binding protein
MNRTQWIASVSVMILTTGVAAGCGTNDSGQPNTTAAPNSSEPYPITIAIQQVSEIPAQGSEVQKLIEDYTNTKLTVQWLPFTNFDEKLNVIIASNELPQMLKVKQSATITAALQTGQFWEIGPYLKDYKNLWAMKEHYDNIAVDGKIYGIPNFRELARGSIVFRKDWLDSLGLQVPTSVDEWYTVLKAMTLNDPDKNGKNDTYGMMLQKNYNEAAVFGQVNRLAVAMGAPNRWGVDNNGKFTPSFVTAPYQDVIKLLRRLYAEKLLNQDFSVLEDTERLKNYDAGRVGVRISAVPDAKSMQDRVAKNNPAAVYDIEPLKGPQGIRVPGELGNVGFFIMSKSTVKTEADLKRILTFADKMMDESMNTLQLRGIEGRHWKKTADGKAEIIDPALVSSEIKPFRDNLMYREGVNVIPLKDTPLGDKANKIMAENVKYAVPQPALTLNSATYSDRGKQLEILISDAETKYIMGKVDDAGYQEEIAKWRKQGGDQMIKEYEEAYSKLKK